MKPPFAPIILPGVGFGKIRFGSDPEDVVSILQLPTEQFTDEDGDLIIVCSAAGIEFLAFDREEDFRLISYELGTLSDAKLWDIDVFRTPRSAMMRIARTQGFVWERVPSLTGGDADEVLYQIKSQSLNFYYRDEKLDALLAGVIFRDPETIAWPSTEASDR